VIGGLFLPVLWAVALYEAVRDVGPWHCPACGRALQEPAPVAAPGMPGCGSDGLAGQARRAYGQLPRWLVWSVLAAAVGVGLLINGCIVCWLAYKLVSLWT